MPPLHSVQPINNSAAALQIAPMLIAPQHPVLSQPAAKLPRPKRKKYERRVSVHKGMSVDSVKVLINEDIRQALAKLGKPSSRKKKEISESLLYETLKEQVDGFKMDFTYYKRN